MGLILPKYLLRRKSFACSRCGLKYFRETPSDVDRCPKCAEEGISIICYAEGANKKNLDKYSQWKERIYSDPSGRRHDEDIRMRGVKKEGGKFKTVWKDDRGRVIDEAPDIPISDNKKNPRYLK